MKYRTLYFTDDDELRILNINKIPSIKYINLTTDIQVHTAICDGSIIGLWSTAVAAAYALALAIKRMHKSTFIRSLGEVRKELKWISKQLITSKPVNALLKKTVIDIVDKCPTDSKCKCPTDSKCLADDFCWEVLYNYFLENANKLYDCSRIVCCQIGVHGKNYINDKSCILNYGFNGHLSSVEYGTSLSPVYHALSNDKKFQLVISETSNGLGRKLAWELCESMIPSLSLTDGMIGHEIYEGKINAVFMSADRVLSDGTCLSVTGSYTVALVAKHHNVPVYMCVPTKVFDFESSDIKNEYNNGRMSFSSGGYFNISCYPSYDVVPSKLITSFITENGIIYPANKDSIESQKHLISS